MKFAEASRRTESQAMVDQAVLLEHLDDASWGDVERCLLRALELDDGNIRALAETALFYDLVLNDHSEARKFATMCRNRAAETVNDRNCILDPATLGDMDSILSGTAGG